MKYQMTVTIINPENNDEITYDLSCVFIYDAEQYGNGYYVSIKGKEFYPQYIDLRYDKAFNPENKTEYLMSWAKNYWSGKNGAYAVKSLEIVKA